MGALERLIKEKSSIQIPKPINELDDTELEEIYGINRETLIKIKKKKVIQLKEFRKLKKETLIKIYHIKEDYGDDDDDEQVNVTNGGYDDDEDVLPDDEE